MTKFCPIRSAGGNSRDCYGEACALYDEQARGCLIRTYLISQIETSNIVIKPPSPTPLEQRVEQLEKDVKYASLGFPVDAFFGGGTK